MAMTPQWRMTVTQWEKTFHEWITAPQPDALLNAQIFFDFRVLYGSRELGERVHSAAVTMGKGLAACMRTWRVWLPAVNHR